MGGGPETGSAREAYTPKPVAEARNIQPLQPGFGMEKIPDNVKDAILAFGIKMRNAKVDGAPAVALDFGKDIRLTANGKDWSEQGHVALDKDTLQIERYALKQDGFNNPDAPLRLKAVNRDGTTDDLVFEKRVAANAPEMNVEASKIDNYLASFESTPQNLRNLMEGAEQKSQFDKIVKNWTTISDASVAKMKTMMREYLRTYEGKGVDMRNIPANFTMTQTEKNGQPALNLDGTGFVVYNGAERGSEKVRPGELMEPVDMAEGQKKVDIVRNAAKEGYMDDNYGYRAIIVDGKRYDVIPGSVRRLRDGGTTYSSFAGNGKKFDLFQPSAFKQNEKATITEA